MRERPRPSASIRTRTRSVVQRKNAFETADEMSESDEYSELSDRSWPEWKKERFLREFRCCTFCRKPGNRRLRKHLRDVRPIRLLGLFARVRSMRQLP